MSDRLQILALFEMEFMQPLFAAVEVTLFPCNLHGYFLGPKVYDILGNFWTVIFISEMLLVSFFKIIIFINIF